MSGNEKRALWRLINLDTGANYVPEEIRARINKELWGDNSTLVRQKPLLGGE